MTAPATNGSSPEAPLDLLIVGGGPCGTAAAWRAHELGLSVLVVDRDCVLSIVKEWSEHVPPKIVDADYGDGAQLPFPQGGALVSQFPYEDQTSSTVLYEKWVKVYDEHNVPYRNGVELGGCERLPNGIHCAELMELQTQAKSKVHARNVLLALGSGSPTKVRLMGDGLGIRYKLGNSNDFVGGPACVVGGGMSAAEAVVTIAMAKVAAKDTSDVFWCYRGRGMPKVAQGKALAGKFYEAWTQGNIRYLPLSEPLAVFKDEKGKELVAVRTRRVEQANQPPELVCYEFEKKQVLALIGSERPTDLLNSMGIREFALADAPAKKRLAVTGIRESQVTGVFMAGGLLHPAHIETTDFRPEALQSTVRESETSFKRAMVEGVSIAEALYQRLRKGTSDEAIRDFQVKRALEAAADAAATVRTTAVVKPAPEPLPVVHELGAAFLQIGHGENPPKADLFFPVGESVVGRTTGRVVVPGDAGLLDLHATFRVVDDECYVSNAPVGGTCHVRVNSERTLVPGNILVVGAQRLRVEDAQGRVVLVRLDENGQTFRPIPLSRTERTIGREDLDPRDFSLSRSHFTATDVGGLVRVRDTSRNGTFLELKGSVRLNEGDEVWMGDQRFRFVDIVSRDVVADAAGAKPVEKPAPEARPVEQQPAATTAAPVVATQPPTASAPSTAAPVGAPEIVLPDGSAVAADGEKPMLSFLAEAMAATDDSGSIGGKCQTLWECWDQGDPCDTGGSCGKCVVTVLEGSAALSEASSKERNTIKKINKKLGGRLDEANCRLACQSRVLGRVRIQPAGKTDG